MRSLALVAALLLGGTSPGSARVFWGDVHAHSGVSDDGSGTVDNFFAVARDVAGLDFVVLSDHDVFTTPGEWELSKMVAESQRELAGAARAAGRTDADRLLLRCRPARP